MNRLGLLTMMMAAIIMFVPEPAFGQVYAPDASHEDPSTQVESLPSWAKPMDQPAESGMGDGPVETHAPTLPPPGSRVPVDGGLIWLVAAGGAFAVYRLRSETSAANPAA